jgi:hypothetical protein
MSSPAEASPSTWHALAIAREREHGTMRRGHDAAVRQAGQLGGRTLLPPTETHIGRFAVIADRQGAPFAVFEGETDP